MEPPYVCDVAGCEEAFSTMDEVIAHERTHRTGAWAECGKCYQRDTVERIERHIYYGDCIIGRDVSRNPDLRPDGTIGPADSP